MEKELTLYEALHQMNHGEIEIMVDEELATAISELKDASVNIDEGTIDLLLSNCKDVVVNTIIGPFGLSRSMFNDQDGGSITTLHNFEKGITSNETDEINYKEFKSKFAEGTYREESKPIIKDIRKTSFQDNEIIKDGYTGKQLSKDGSAHVDHIVSLKEIHDNPKINFAYSFKEKIELAHLKDNLTFTDSRINQSKGSDDMKDWMKKEKIAGLKNKDRFEIDEKEALKKDAKAREIETKAKDIIHKKYAGELLKNGVKESLTLGLRQALGILLKEFVSEVFKEIKDIIKNGIREGKEDQKILEALKLRFTRVWHTVIENCKKKNKEFMSAFKEGFLSGLVNTLIVFLVNTVVTTIKRVVKIIREGILSVFKAIKLLVSPPKDLTKEDIAFEVLKLLSAAVITSIGIFLEEAFEKFLLTIPLLAPFASIIAPVLMGIITGLTITLILYAFDKMKNGIKLREAAKVKANMGLIVANLELIRTAVNLDTLEKYTNIMDDDFDDMESEFYSLLGNV
jgi:hypothetical protein